MPPIEVTDTAGKRFSLPESKGKVVLVNFWATWCGPCRLEMPRLEREIWKRYRSENFVMVAIAREQTAKEISAFENKSHYTFPVAPDPKRNTYKLFADSGIPRSYVVGPDGSILFQSVGYCEKSFNDMEVIIQQKLAGLTKN